MNTFKGKISTFGGPDDSGMTSTEGLAVYENLEANNRPDLFNPRSYDLSIGTSKRLKPESFYFAYRYQLEPRIDRKVLQNTKAIITNPSNGKSVEAHLVDWGPHERTGRIIDVSPGVAKELDLKTDDLVEFEVIEPTGMA